jgi:hypothetical protein
MAANVMEMSLNLNATALLVGKAKHVQKKVRIILSSV